MVACTTPTPGPTVSATPTDVPATPWTGAVVRLVTTAGQVTAGKTVVIEIDIENVTQLHGMALHLHFNPAQLEVVDADAEFVGVQITHGDFLSSGGVVQNQVDNTAGTVTYVWMQVASMEPLSGGGTLATLVVCGKAVGALDVAITELSLTDVAGNPIPVTILQKEP